MGLKTGDLADLISNIISIDEYESKIDEDAIVVALYAKFREPADDLNKFIQKVGKDILDTDVSPSVTSNGDYVVFIEMYRNDEFITDLLFLMKYITELTLNEEWFFSYYKHEKIYELTEENLKDVVRLEDKDTSNITEFFSNSVIDGIEINEKEFSIIKNNKVRAIYEYVELLEEYNYVEDFLTEQDLKELFTIENLFGNITAEKCADGYIFYNGINYMKVKEI